LHCALKTQLWHLIKSIQLKFGFGLKRLKVLFLVLKNLAIRKTGSITNAAKEMNQRAESPLVDKLLGGKGGGGARLTKAGEKAIVTFYEIEKRI
jgi:molybdate transport repressor ModE-like protein